MAAAFLGACTAKAPAVDDPGGDEPELSAFADIVVAYTESGIIASCTEAVAECDGPQTSACNLEEVLGAPDGVTWTLEAGGRLEIAFRCGAILETGAPSDFRIWADVPSGATAVVEVSLDGSAYTTLDFLDTSDQAIDLAEADVTTTRFVRITDTGAGGVAIDAVEALR